MGEKRRADGERQGQQSGAGLEALDQERELIPASILRAFDAQPQLQVQAEPQQPPPADSIQAMMNQPVPALPAPRANEDPWVRHIRALRLERAKEAADLYPLTDAVPKHHDKVWGVFGDAEAIRAKLDAMAAQFFFAGLAKSTLSAQDSAVRSYMFFCGKLLYDPFPAAEETIIAFAVWSSTRLTADSIEKYVNHVRNKHLELGRQMPSNADMPRFQRIIRGIGYMQRATKDGRVRLPMTFSVMVQMEASNWIWYRGLAQGERPDIYSLQNPFLSHGMYNTGFVGCLRPGEFTVRRTSGGVITRPLRLKDLKFHDDRYGDGTREAILNLPKRKNQQFGEFCDVAMGELDHDHVCSYKSLKYMLAARKAVGEVLTEESYLFATKDKDGNIIPVTYEMMLVQLSSDLERAGFDSKEYKGHSFRLGAATTMALNGVPDHLIQDLGGWSRNSQVYKIYLGRAPQEQRAKMAVYLTRPYAPLVYDGAAGFWKLAEGPR